MRRILVLNFLLGLLACPASGQPTAPGTQRFDGRWAVVITCQQAADGASGYVFEFNADVKNGQMRGDNGRVGRAGSVSLDGTLNPDGSAMLHAQGLTGNPGYTVGRVKPETPFSFHMKAQFDASRGTGTRIELRPCDADFRKL